MCKLTSFFFLLVLNNGNYVTFASLLASLENTKQAIEIFNTFIGCKIHFETHTIYPYELGSTFTELQTQNTSSCCIYYIFFFFFHNSLYSNLLRMKPVTLWYIRLSHDRLFDPYLWTKWAIWITYNHGFWNVGYGKTKERRLKQEKIYDIFSELDDMYLSHFVLMVLSNLLSISRGKMRTEWKSEDGKIVEYRKRSLNHDTNPISMYVI